MITEDKEPSLFQRIASVMAEAEQLKRQSRKGLPYKTISHDDVTHALRPAMMKHGILAFPIDMETRQDGNRTEVQMKVRIQAVSSFTADYIDIPTFGYGIDQQDKGPGKAMSYAFKYALMKAFMLETGEDVDLGPSQNHVSKPSGKPQF
jgi:hypothetical protein